MAREVETVAKGATIVGNRPPSALVIVLIIGFVVFSFLSFIIKHQVEMVDHNLEAMGRAVANQVLIIRKWASGYRGIWVDTESGSYHEVKNGMYLKTPAIITSEISRLTWGSEYHSFKLASDRPVNPVNAPDEYEKAAMAVFAEGKAKTYTRLIYDNKTFRYIIPIYIEDSCLECHGFQGYKEDDLRGVLSVIIPAEAAIRERNISIVLYAVGSVIIFLLSSMLATYWIKHKYVMPLNVAHNKANTDFLTGLFNHGYFQETLRSLFFEPQEELSLVLADIDNFKSVNDTYGHAVGDLVLKELAGVFRSAVRETDIPARYGGEEFAVILPNASGRKAREIAERILYKVRDHNIITPDVTLKVTVSIGVATKKADMAVPRELIERADQALYHAKRTGKNRVVCR